MSQLAAPLAALGAGERLLRRGTPALSDAELLSVVLLNGSAEAAGLGLVGALGQDGPAALSGC